MRPLPPPNKFRSQWPIFHGPVMFLLLFFALKNILVLLAELSSGELHCPATALIFCSNDDPRLTLTYFTVRSNLFLMFLYGKKLKQKIFLKLL